MGTVKYTGPVASFHCPTNAEIRSLKVHFSPKQEGSGDPSPENVREIEGWDGVEVQQSGKNLLDESLMKNATYNKWGWNNILKPNTTYTWSVFGESTFRYGLQLGSSYEAAPQPNKRLITYIAPGSSGQFTTPSDMSEYPYIYIAGNGSGAGLITTVKFKLELGSTGTSYEPYHGFTANYEFGVLGKNKFNWDVPVSESSPVGSDPSTAREFTLDTYVIGMSVNNYYRQNYTNWVLNPSVENGVISFSSGSASGYGIAFPLKLIAGQTYFLSGAGDGSVGATYYDGNGELISFQGNRLNKTIMVPENAATTLIGFYANTANTEFTFSNIQLELGSTATAYEPYDPNKTVYGGWVDLVSGEVCEEWVTVNTNWGIGGASTLLENVERRRFVTPSVLLDTEGNNGLCNIAAWGWDYTKDAIHFYSYNTGYSYVFLPIGTSDETTIQIAYKLANPNIFTFPPHSSALKTFLSHNNIWSNADYVEVEYDLHETQDILARKQFIVANQPHVVTPVAAPLQNFVTDMAAPLKECKVYFGPVQEGEGIPSPDNVRPISGWTEIEIYQSGKNLMKNNGRSYTNGDTTWTVNSDGSVHVVQNTSTANKWWTANSDGYWAMLKKGIAYTLQGGKPTAPIYLVGKDDDGTTWAEGRIGGTDAGSSRTFTLQQDAVARYQIVAGKNNSIDTIVYPMLTIENAITDYEPYNGTTIPITFPSEAGTVYGGYVDLVTGEVWKTWDVAEAGSLNWSTGNNRARSNDLKSSIKATTGSTEKAHLIGEQIKPGSMNMNLTNYPNTIACASDSQLIMYYDGVLPQGKIVYELKEPVLLTTLTLQQLKTLRGTNNIWSSANGDIELAYWTH